MCVTVSLRILLSFAKILQLVQKLRFVLIVLITLKLAVFGILQSYETQNFLSFAGPYHLTYLNTKSLLKSVVVVVVVVVVT